MKKKINRRSIRKSVKFNPSHELLSNAVNEYLANGGTIKKLEFDEKAYRDFVSSNEGPIAVDEFLRGN